MGDRGHPSHLALSIRRRSPRRRDRPRRARRWHEPSVGRRADPRESSSTRPVLVARPQPARDVTATRPAHAPSDRHTRSSSRPIRSGRSTLYRATSPRASTSRSSQSTPTIPNLRLGDPAGDGVRRRFVRAWSSTSSATGVTTTARATSRVHAALMAARTSVRRPRASISRRGCREASSRSRSRGLFERNRRG